MSRVGKNPVIVPAGVTLDLKGQHLKAKGKRGELQYTVHDDVEVTRDGDKLNFKPRNDSRRARMQWGTARNLARGRAPCRPASRPALGPGVFADSARSYGLTIRTLRSQIGASPRWK